MTKKQKEIIDKMKDGYSVFVNTHNVMLSKNFDNIYYQSRTFFPLVNAGLIHQDQSTFEYVLLENMRKFKHVDGLAKLSAPIEASINHHPKPTTMSKHTPTRVAVDEHSDGYHLIDQNGLDLLIPGILTETECRLNAERMAAIWNAMEGLSNEEVEGMREHIKNLSDCLLRVRRIYVENDHDKESIDQIIIKSQKYIKP